MKYRQLIPCVQGDMAFDGLMAHQTSEVNRVIRAWLIEEPAAGYIVVSCHLKSL